MITKLKILFNIMMVALVVGFTACDGDEGQIGPKGSTGVQGEAGDQGDKGDQAVIDDEDLSFGNIVATITGKTPEGADFSQTIDFNYLSDGLSSSSYTEGSDQTKIFSIGRSYKASASEVSKTSNYYGDPIEFEFKVNQGVVSPTVFYIDVNINDEEGFFEIYNNQSFDGPPPIIIMPWPPTNPEQPTNTGRVAEPMSMEITNYDFDATTGSLKFDFAYSFVDYNVATVNISGTADLIVLKDTNLD